MNEAIYKQLIAAVNTYYKDEPSKNFAALKEIIEDKIINIDRPSEWSSLIGSMRHKFGEVDDMAFLQFPNRKLSLVLTETVGLYTAAKNFTICLSLLCPVFTYYYDYIFTMNLGSGHIKLTSIAFLTNQKFKLISRGIELEKITSLVKAEYPAYEFFDHYALMVNKVNAGLPYGSSPLDSEYSLYRYLFDGIEPDQIYS